MKADAGKPRLSLLPSGSLETVLDVFEHGARKYNPNVWKFVERVRYLDAAGRHLMALLRGEETDTDSGLPHWAHLVCCGMIIGGLTPGKENK